MAGHRAPGDGPVLNPSADMVVTSPRSSRAHLAPEDAFDSPASPPPQPNMLPRRPRLKDRSRTRRSRRTWRKLLWVKQSCPDNYTDQATFLENLQRNPRLQPYEFWPLVADSTVILQQVCSVTIFVVCFVGIFQERVSPVAVVGWGSFATFLGWLVWDWWVGQEGPDEVLQRQDSNRRSAAAGSTTHPRYNNSNNHYRNSSSSNLGSRRHSAQMMMTASAASSTTNLAATATATSPVSPDRSLSQNNLAALRFPSHPHSASVVSFQSTLSASQQQQSDINSSNYNRPSRASTDSAEDPVLVSSPAHPPPPAPPPPFQPPRRTPTATSSTSASPSLPITNNNNLDGRTSLRLGTIKSAILIYCTLLGLSPILKSLTRSTSSDSIWAMSFWLLAVNIFFYDYSSGSSSSGSSGSSGSGSGVGSGAVVGGGGGVAVHRKFPAASLSTNAALMASTVLASRLPSTGQVFSLTLFSIEVFGLFPVFRRYARHRSWRYHAALSVLLVAGAGAGVGMILGGSAGGGGGGGGGGNGNGAAASFGGGNAEQQQQHQQQNQSQNLWKSGLTGVLVAAVVAVVAMGGCSWWLIGLQKYKNAINGPWDQARPIIISRPQWDDD